MQATLLGLAIAAILALVSALVAPLVVDWNAYRPYFEARASALVGVPVRITGAIDARILPSPLLKLRSVEIGPTGNAPLLRIGAIAVDVALGPLLGGEVRAKEMRLVEPEITAALTRDGQIVWPRATAGFRADALSITRLAIEQGKAVLTDAGSAGRLVVERLSFAGEVRSLAGPIKGEGSFAIGNESFSYKISTGRSGDDGATRLRVHLDATNRPMAAEAEGVLTFGGGAPQFDGTAMIARPAAVMLTGGNRVISDPWRAAGRVKARPASALLEQFEFQYGPDERAIKLGGTAELKFGERPRFDGVFSARQLDFDRALASPDSPRRLPLAAIKAFVETLADAPEPPMPIQIGLGADAVTLGGTVIQSLRGDLSFDAGRWNLDRVEFRAPGTSQISLSGQIDVAPQGVSFRGPVTVDAGDLKPLVAWLEGRGDVPAGPIKPLRARGDVTIGPEMLAVERLRASLDRETLEGRVVYSWASRNRPAGLEADLGAAELDVDAILGFANAVRTATALELPREVALAINLGRATFVGVEARNVNAKLKLDAGALQIERLSVADLGGAAIDASGRVDELSSTPRGRVRLDVDARSLAGLTTIAARYAPQAVEQIRRYGERLAPARLRAILNMDGSAGDAAMTARLSVDGRLGAIAVSLSGQVTGRPDDIAGAEILVHSRFESDDGGALVALTGLDRVIAVDTRPARINVFAFGRANGTLRFESSIAAGGLDATAKGTLRPVDGQGMAAALDLAVVNADARPLRRALAGQSAGALPVGLTTRIALSGTQVAFSEIAGKIGDADVRGGLDIGFGAPVRVEGALELGSLDVATLIAAAIGMAPQGSESAGAGRWSVEPFAPNVLAEIAGSIKFKADQAAITSKLVARAAQGVVRFAQSEIVLDDVESTLGGGRLSARLAFRHSADGVGAQARIRLTGADAAAVIAGGQRPPINGRLALQLEVEGTGLSPAALIGSLHGTGTVTLEGGQFAGIDPKAFDVAIRVADQARKVDTTAIQNAVTGVFDGGSFALPASEVAITVNGGQARIGNLAARANESDLTVAGAVDLIDGLLDARLTLTGPAAQNLSAAGRPGIVLALKGSVDAPKRTLDVSALTGWLALRAADQQARQIEAIEVIRRSSPIGPIVRPESPSARATAPGTVSESGPSAAAAANPRDAAGLDLLRRERGRAASDGPAAVDDVSAPGGAPAAGDAPPLPAPIEVKPAPGSSGALPARTPTRAENAPIVTEPPRERRPPRIIQPPHGNVRPPLDLLRP